MKSLQSIFMGINWKKPPVIIATTIFCLLIGLGIYYMATVDAMNSSLGSSWIWFLVATIAFVVLELYFRNSDEPDQPRTEPDPDASNKNYQDLNRPD